VVHPGRVLVAGAGAVIVPALHSGRKLTESGKHQGIASQRCSSYYSLIFSTSWLLEKNGLETDKRSTRFKRIMSSHSSINTEDYFMVTVTECNN
jgi:hypothetical protein